MKTTTQRNALVSLVVMVVPVLIAAAICTALWGGALKGKARRIGVEVGQAVGILPQAGDGETCGMSVDLSTGAVNINGERVGNSVATKTQVTDAAQTVSGTIALRNQEQYPILISAPSKYIYAEGGGCRCTIEDISTDGWLGPDPQPAPDPTKTLELMFVCKIEISGGFMAGTEAHEFVYIYSPSMMWPDFETPKPWDIEREFSITTSGQRLWRALSSTKGTGRENAPVYAKENSVADEWQTAPPVSWSVSFGGLSVSGTQTWNEGMGIWEPSLVFPTTGLLFAFSQHKGVTGYTYADLSVTWSAVDLSFDGMGKTVGPLVFTGAGNTITMDVGTSFSGSAGHSITVARPYLPDFSDFSVVDRGGNLVENVLVKGGFVADKRYPWTKNCPLA